MKIVLINTSERTGGAAVAANRLMHALQAEGHEVKLIVRDKQTNNPNVVTVNTSWLKEKINYLRFVWERLIIFIATGFNKEILFQVSIANTGTDISQHPLVKEADIVHLHWINQGFLSLQDIKSLTKSGKVIVWTIHDLWITNGIYHYIDNAISSWLDRMVFKQKEKIDFSKITIVGCSKWISDCARSSLLLKKASITSIPNPIDTSVFRPIGKEEASSLIDIGKERFIILFGAAKLTDTRKGLVFFLKACQLLLKRNPALKDCIQIELLGKASQDICDLFPVKVHTLGYMTDAEKMAAAYSIANLFVIPSLEDNLPNTIMESMACGTPCVGFNTGGIPEMIDHKINGYLAEYKSAEDLANGIEWVLNHPEKDALSNACVMKVQTHYSESVVARQYIELYKSLLKK